MGPPDGPAGLAGRHQGDQQERAHRHPRHTGQAAARRRSERGWRDRRGRRPGRRAAGLDGLAALADAVTAAGAPVRLTIEGERAALPTSVDHAAYRILQESLTNVLRHAGPEAAATIRLSFSADALTIQVTDDGDGPGPPQWGARTAGRARDHRDDRAGDGAGRRTEGRARGRKADSRSRPGWPLRRHPAWRRGRSPATRRARRHDPGAARRRPGTGAGRIPDAAGDRPTTSRSSARRPTAASRSRSPGNCGPTWC